MVLNTQIVGFFMQKLKLALNPIFLIKIDVIRVLTLFSEETFWFELSMTMFLILASRLNLALHNLL